MAGLCSSRALRADALRNRDTIIQAARTAFAEQGVDVPLEEIARRAGVGIGTLYRRFPTRERLVAAAFEPKVRAYAAAVDEAVAHADAWEGFSGFVLAVCAMQAADAGFAGLSCFSAPPNSELERQLAAATDRLGELVERAKADGALRSDFAMEDLMLLLMANAGVVDATKGSAPRSWERFAAYMLDAFRAQAASTLPEPTRGSRISRVQRQR